MLVPEQQNSSAMKSSFNTPMTNWTDEASDKSTKRLDYAFLKTSLNNNVRSTCNAGNRHNELKCLMTVTTALSPSIRQNIGESCNITC